MLKGLNTFIVGFYEFISWFYFHLCFFWPCIISHLMDRNRILLTAHPYNFIILWKKEDHHCHYITIACTVVLGNYRCWPSLNGSYQPMIMLCYIIDLFWLDYGDLSVSLFKEINIYLYSHKQYIYLVYRLCES